MGTGIEDMIQRCHDAGLAELEFRIDAGCLVFTIQRKVQKITPHGRDQVGTKSGSS